MPFLPKVIYKVYVIPVKNVNDIFPDIEKTIHMDYKRLQIAKEVLHRKNKAGGIKLPDFKIDCEATEVTITSLWHKKQSCKPMQQNILIYKKSMQNAVTA